MTVYANHDLLWSYCRCSNFIFMMYDNNNIFIPNMFNIMSNAISHGYNLSELMPRPGATA